MKHTKFVPFLIVLMLVVLPLSLVSAQEEPASQDSLVRSISFGTEAMIISSPTNDTDYLIYVNLPSGYNTIISQSYPVLYLFDPWHTFGTVTDQIRLLPYGGELPKIIVVGVGYPAMLDLGKKIDSLAMNDMGRLRTRDLSPDQQPELFLEFLTETLIPHIDSTYRTDPNDRAIMGHSAGGDFVLYSLFHAQGTFHRFVASSPGSGFPADLCVSCEFENRPDISGIVFLSSGENDGLAPQYVEDAFSILQEHADENFNLTVSAHIFEGTSHLSVVPYALSRGLQSVYCGAGYVSGTQCRFLGFQQAESIEDTDFQPDKTFTTPDRSLPLRSGPVGNAARVGTCRNMEATVLQAVQYSDGQVWIQLACADNVGWVHRSLLED